MKLLLIHPDFHRGTVQPHSLKESFSPPALGVNILASHLEANGHQVDVLDSVRLLFRYGPRNIKNIEEEVRELVLSDEVDIVGMNVTSPTRIVALRLAHSIRELSPMTKIVFGGPHPTVLGPQLFERYSDIVDVVVVGEGEETLSTLTSAIENNVSLEGMPGVISSMGLGPVAPAVQDLDDSPLPDFSKYVSEPYGEFFDTIPIMTARGCPYKCAFCYSRTLWNGSYRCRMVSRVVDEIEHGIRILGVTKIHFNDDVFSVPLDRAKSILREMRNRQLRAQLYCTTRIDSIDDEFLSLFEDTGGGCIYFGIESGSERIRSIMNKNLTNEAILEGFAMLKRHPSIYVGVFLIFGYPTEGINDITETENLLRKVRPDEVTCNIAHVHPGTELFEIAVREKLYSLNDWLDDKCGLFPYQRDTQKLQRLQRVCLFFEEQFGRPLRRGSLICDMGSVPRNSSGAFNTICTQECSFSCTNSEKSLSNGCPEQSRTFSPA